MQDTLADDKDSFGKPQRNLQVLLDKQNGQAGLLKLLDGIFELL